MGSWKGRENQYIQFVSVLYCKLPAFPLEAVPGTEPRPQRWEAPTTYEYKIFNSSGMVTGSPCFFFWQYSLGL